MNWTNRFKLESEGEENDDPLIGIAPMAPLGGRASNSRPSFSPYEMRGERTHNIQTMNTTGLISGGKNTLFFMNLLSP